MISCKRATELLSLRMDQKLGLRLRLALGIHLAICSFCRAFSDQLSELRRVMVAKRTVEDEAVEIPDGAKERVKARLQENTPPTD